MSVIFIYVGGIGDHPVFIDEESRVESVEFYKIWTEAHSTTLFTAVASFQSSSSCFILSNNANLMDRSTSALTWSGTDVAAPS